MERRAESLKEGIYPYAGTYMDSRSGRRLDDTVVSWLNANHTNDDTHADQEVLETLAKRLGFANSDDALAHVVPMVPKEVRDLAIYTELFTDESVYLQLRPLLYTYWS
jgi:acetate kinase